MPKNRKSNKELKKTPALSLKEKRAAKHAKSSEVPFLVDEKAPRHKGAASRPKPA